MLIVSFKHSIVRKTIIANQKLQDSKKPRTTHVFVLEYCQLYDCHCQRRRLQWWVVGGSQQPLSNVKVW